MPVKLREACQHGPPSRNTSTGQRCSTATTRHTAPLQAAQHPSQYQYGTLALIVGCAACNSAPVPLDTLASYHLGFNDDGITAVPQLTPEQLEEEAACNPSPVRIEHFNPNASIPYGVTIEHVCAAMNEFIDFIRMVDQRMHENGTTRFESILMPANFSSIVGEFMSAGIPKHCPTIAKNHYHNGHPDMVPAGRFPNDSVQYAHEGIEIKGSRYLKGWQGHNPENIWLMVFMFDSNRPVDVSQGIGPKPFRFLRVVGAQLTEDDWQFAGRSETSRRTITAAVKASGYQKMMNNWIYNAPDLPL